LVAIGLLYAWALSFIVQFAPLEESSDYPEARESPDARKVRYESIVRDAVRVVYDPRKPPVLNGTDARARYLILMESTMSFESHFRRDVDLDLGPKSRGCFGSCVCLMQINVGVGSVRIGSQQMTANDLLEDRLTCLQAGDALLRYSWNHCRVLNPEYRLAAYISGNCQERTRESAYRWYRATSWVRKNPPPVKDSEVLEELSATLAMTD